MKSNNKPIPRPFNRQAAERKSPQSNVAGKQPASPAAHTLQFKPTVAQSKRSVPVNARRQPNAPPVYAPQALPRVLQRKEANAPQQKAAPAAPLAYRPQPIPMVLQTKMATQKGGVRRSETETKSSTTPHVYGPQPKPRVLQTKSANPANVQAPTRSAVGTAGRERWKVPAAQSTSGVVQRASRARAAAAAVDGDDEVKVAAVPGAGEFNELIGTKGAYVNKPAFVVTFSNEGDEQSRRVGEITDYYGSLKCSVKGALSWDYKKGEMGALPKRQISKLKLTKDSLLVVTGHGNLQFLFGATPGHEAEAMTGFVRWIHAFEESTKCTLSTVVLDSCWSAAELKDPVEGVSSHSSARILSRLLGDGYKVIGFNGKAQTGNVAYEAKDGGATKADYGANAVVFVGGKVIKGSIHKDMGEGILHKGNFINREHEFYAQSFPDGQPKLYRTNSFSKASREKPQ